LKRRAVPAQAARVPAVGREEFRRRRRALAKQMGRDSIAIVPTSPVRLRNNDVEYAYRPDSDFFYLTGFTEPEAVAVLVPGRPQGEYILFVRDRDPARETWDGRRAGPEGAVRGFGADHAFPITDIDEILPGLIENRAKVFYAMGTHPEFDQRVVGWVNGLRTQARNGRHAPQEMVALDHVLHDMRLFKSRAEVETMRSAATIAAQAHVRAMRACSPGKREYEIAAEIIHEFRRHNADLSYLPIVGGGANGCILHYRENDAELANGDLLLIDAGCEVDCYASDITRTFPVNGRFTPEQRALYDIVLEANYAAINRVKPGNHWNEPHEAAVRVITQGLVKVGLLKGKAAKLEQSGAYRKYFMHRTGHGLGIRIEDDVVVTRDGCEVLTGGVPKDPVAIERLMAAVA
jgi:Xaa-Pro aminopeptidase